MRNDPLDTAESTRPIMAQWEREEGGMLLYLYFIFSGFVLLFDSVAAIAGSTSVGA